MDLRLLQMFDAVCRTGGVTSAAAHLNLTQSAVSHGMKRLEEQLGCTLLSRKGKSLHLTPEGRFFYGHCLKVLETVEHAVDSVKGRYSENRGTLDIVFSTSMAHLLLAPVLREFRECYPSVSVSVVLKDTAEALREVEEGRCDLALAIRHDMPDSLAAHDLFQDRLFFMVSPQHAWAQRKRISETDMRQEHYLLYQRSSVTSRLVRDFFLKSGVRPKSHVEIPNFDIMKQMARLGLGVALMAEWVAESELREASLVAKPLPKFAIQRKWAVIHQKAHELRQHELTFIGLCKMFLARAV